VSIDVHVEGYSANYTHNVGGMWNLALTMANNRRKLAGKKPLTPNGLRFYDFLHGGEKTVTDPDGKLYNDCFVMGAWLPGHGDIKPPTARRVAKVLRAMAFEMRHRPDAYRAMNPANGWGDYDGALRYIESFAEACETAPPDERIQVST